MCLCAQHRVKDERHGGSLRAGSSKLEEWHSVLTASMRADLPKEKDNALLGEKEPAVLRKSFAVWASKSGTTSNVYCFLSIC